MNAQASRPKDFKKYWSDTLALAAKQPLDARLRRLEHPIPEIELYDLRYKGFGGVELAAHYLLPAKRQGRIPAVLQSHGYLACKSDPSAHLPWLIQGMAVLAVDVRGQAGDSGDKAYPSGGPGCMTRGILDKDEYYLRGAYADTYSALRFLRSRSEIDPSRILANGDSQGGGLALVAACLDSGVALCAADNPSLIDFPGRLALGAQGSAEEIRSYLRTHPERRDKVMQTLSYVDILHLLPELRCPSFWSASDNDPICPLPTIQAGFAAAPGKRKHLTIHASMGHDVHPSQLGAKLAWVRKHFFAGN